MWEHAGDFEKAREAYELALDEVKVDISKGAPTEEVVKRGVGISLKIGDLWVEEGKDALAERYYVWGLEELLKGGLDEKQAQKVNDIVAGREDLPESQEHDGEENPRWLKTVEVVGALERLGDLYARVGNVA